MQRHNVVGIQMLTKSLRSHIFRNSLKEKIVGDIKKKDGILNHLKRFKIPYQKTQNIDNVEINLPTLEGKTITEHFTNIAREQIKMFVILANEMKNAKLPNRPKEWKLQEGWTKYDSISNQSFAVDYPNEDVFVIDVECFVPTGGHPLMVTAVSPSGWYSWCSKYLLGDSISAMPTLSDLIEVTDKNRSGKKTLLIGYNVGFDRTFMREQYLIEAPSTNFLDAMSMHIALSGFTGYQRAMHLAHQKGRDGGKSLGNKIRSLPVEKWIGKSCMNNLNDVYQFYCKKEPLAKQMRNVFVEGSVEEVRANFQDLMTYCSQDVVATHEVFQVLWPEFQKRFPHPVTLGGMFEMGKSFLPINENWFKYMENSQREYDKLEERGLSLLRNLAEKAKLKAEGEKYKDDLFLWGLDWKMKSKRTKNLENVPVADAKKKAITAKRKTTEASPKWFVELCDVDENDNLVLSKLSLQMRIAVKLLQLTWKGFPLHHSPLYGWGYLVPISSDIDKLKDNSDQLESNTQVYPLRQLISYCNEVQPEVTKRMQEESSPYVMEKTELDELESIWETFDRDNLGSWKSVGAAEDLPILNVVPGCYFHRLPHEDGSGKNVGNPLSKGFHQDIDRGILGSLLGREVDAIMKQGSISSYWKNNVKRVRSQFVIQLDHKELPRGVTSNGNYDATGFYGAILPRIVTAGTVTRRAVEPTWLTASNAYKDRIGSELKSMVQAPPGYSFVGADVDSQELWIASLLGDACFAGEHGCTAFGWMTLQGNKADGTDMHSRVADMLGISREHAKIFNYARIYGAGIKFAEKMLLKFNHTLSKDEARKRATNMFHATKGKKDRSQYLKDGDTQAETGWAGGSESHMFNMLEKIASSKQPKTPVLKASMSKALEPLSVGKDFVTSRVNWVVQSSAVDYLHLMLVCMKWLFEKYDIKGRFCISIHDEVRYLVSDSDKYRAALALQITNLLTRSMFVHELKFDDLPQINRSGLMSPSPMINYERNFLCSQWPSSVQWRLTSV